MSKRPVLGVDYQLIAGRQYTIPPAPRKMGKRMEQRISLLKSLLRQIQRADAKGQMRKCHKLSDKLTEVAMQIEGHYWQLSPIEIAAWSDGEGNLIR